PRQYRAGISYVCQKSNIQQQQATNQELWTHHGRIGLTKKKAEETLSSPYNHRCPCASDCCGALKTNRYILKEKINEKIEEIRVRKWSYCNRQGNTSVLIRLQIHLTCTDIMTCLWKISLDQPSRLRL
ncbi:unnamed protein product, partial [Ectocarpus sp. 12 AP-2014]